MKLLFIPILLSFSTFIVAQNIQFNDQNFKQALLDHSPTIDVDNNDEISYTEAFNTTSLSIIDKNITDLTGIEFFTEITYLYASKNPLTSINLSQNTKIGNLSLSDFLFEEIDLSKLANLKALSVFDGELVNLDLTNNPLVNSVFAYNNELASVNFSGIDTIMMIIVNDNNLDSIDVSDVRNLRSISFKNNNLKYLDLSKNMRIDNGQSSVEGIGNPLERICAPTHRVLVNIWTVPENTIVTDDCNAIFIQFTDDSLKQALINHNPIIDLNSDGEISVSEAELITTIDITNKGITNLDGLEYFINLNTIKASDNQIDDFDATLFNQLNYVDFNNNLLTYLDFSTNVSTLQFVQLNNNNLDSVNILSSPKLATFWANDNNLRNIDLSNSSQLFQLVLNNNQLKTIGAKNCENLSSIEINNNKVSEIDLEGTSKLVIFKADSNNIEQLNFSNQTNLFSFSTAFTIINNPLKQMCIGEIHKDYIDVWGIPENTEVSTFCNFGFVPFSDSLLRKFISKNTEIDINSDGEISLYEANLVQSILLSGFGYNIDTSEWFYDLSGIEYFNNAFSMSYFRSNVSALNLSNMSNLKLFTLGDSKLETAKLSNIPQLEALSLMNNSLNELDLSIDIKQSIKALNISNNQLNSIDVSDFTNLTSVICNGNNNEVICIRPGQIDSVTWTKDESQVFSTTCGSNIINFQNNVLKQALLNHEPAIDTDDDNEISYKEANVASSLILNSIGLADISELSYFINITQLDVSFNNLQNINVSIFNNLSTLIANDNNISQIIFFDTLANGAIEEEIENTSIVNIDLSNNGLSNLDVSKVVNLNTLNTINNQDLLGICVNENQLDTKTINWQKDITTSYGVNCELLTSVFQIQNKFVATYPNPASNYLFVSSEEKIKSVEFSDLNGKQIASFKVNNVSGTIPINNLSDGLYILKINFQNDLIKYKKVIIKK